MSEEKSELHELDEAYIIKLEEENQRLKAIIKQTKELVNLYFEGCASDTFDDAVRALRKALGEAK